VDTIAIRFCNKPGGVPPSAVVDIISNLSKRLIL
jgi:hypothetical protein